MLNQSGIKCTKAVNVDQILVNTQLQHSVGIIVSNADYVEEDGRKIVKAGTPMFGSLVSRGTAFTKATTSNSTSNAIGVLLHDVDVTNGNANGTLLIFGFVNINRLDSTTKSLITDEVKTALNAKVTFIA